MVVCLFVLGFWQTTSLSRVHPAFCSMGIWIGTSPPTMQIWIGGRKRLDEYLCRTVKFVKFYLLSFLMPFWLDCSWKRDFKSQWDLINKEYIKSLCRALIAAFILWQKCPLLFKMTTCRSWAIWEIICNCLNTDNTATEVVGSILLNGRCRQLSKTAASVLVCDVTFGVRLRQWWRQQVLCFWCCFWPVVYLTTAMSKTRVYAHVGFYRHVSEFPKLFRGQWCNS